MQSTYKFHLALAVLDKLDKENISIDKKLFVKIGASAEYLESAKR